MGNAGKQFVEPVAIVCSVSCTPKVRLNFWECTPGLHLNIFIAHLAGK